MFHRRNKTIRKSQTRRFQFETLERRELFSVACLDDPTSLDCSDAGDDIASADSTPAAVAPSMANSTASNASDPSDRQGKRLAFDLEVTDTAGNAVSTVRVGDQLVLNVYVDDLRELGQGVFSAYVDVIYDAGRASVADPLRFSDSYASARAGDTTIPGLIDEAGALAGLSKLGGERALLFSVPFKADAEGQLTFSTDPADILPRHETLLYTEPVGTHEVRFGSVTIDVEPERQFHNLDEPCDVSGDGSVSHDDVRPVVEYLNAGRVGELTDISLTPGANPPYLDVNDDGLLTPLDVLVVINKVNQLDRDGGESPGLRSVVSTTDWDPGGQTMPAQTPATFDLTVAGFAGTLKDLDVTLDLALNVDHGTCDVELISPSGTRSVIYTAYMTDSSDSPIEIREILDDEGVYLDVWTGYSRGQLSAFDGEDANGTWKLSITARGDSWEPCGVDLRGWSLELTMVEETLSDIAEDVANAWSA